MSDEELLAWTRKVNYDDYVDSWLRLATSNDSEGILNAGGRHKLFV
jgi:hypothetical protein